MKKGVTKERFIEKYSEQDFKKRMRFAGVIK